MKNQDLYDAKVVIDKGDYFIPSMVINGKEHLGI